MKSKPKRILTVAAVLLLLYGGSYSVLRFTRYFVRQEFLTFGCCDRIRAQYPDDAGPVKDGHVAHGFESMRNQVGCGRIQKGYYRRGERILVPLFRPLGELEMRLRGYHHAELMVRKYVSEFERYGSDSNRVYFARESAVTNMMVSRAAQVGHGDR